MNEPQIGLIFDMDETLVNTGNTWHAMHASVLGPYGYKRTPEVHDAITGLNVIDQAAVVHRMFKIPRPLEELRWEMRERLIHNFETEDIEAMPGAHHMVDALRGLGPMAVASGSPKEAIDAAMHRLNFAKDIHVIVSSESVKNGKPAPDVFLEAAKRIGVAPGRCVVFEDSPHGAEGGQAAGMKTIVCATPHGPITIGHAKPHADVMLESWGDVTRAMVEGLFAERKTSGQ